MPKIVWAFFAILLAFANTSLALHIGDPAPPLQVTEWFKGGPSSLGDGKHIYVIDLWATWCKPCKESLSHISRLQAKYKDKGVIVIGLSDEPSSDVRPFVKRHDLEMLYTVATDASEDTRKRYTQNTPGYQGIPFSIIVDTQGKVVWFSNDLDTLDPVLDSLLNGTYDEAAIKASTNPGALYTQYFTLINAGDNESAAKVGERFLVEAADDLRLLVDFTESIHELAIRNLYLETEFKVDRPLAQRAAEVVYKASKGKDAAFIAFYAAVLFRNGNIDSAIKYQQEALHTNTDKNIKRPLKKALREYQQGKRKKARDPSWHPASLL